MLSFCISPAIMCSKLDVIENGSISYSPDSGGPVYDFGTVATYACDRGFQLVGSSNRTCGGVSSSTMGTFNGSAPACKDNFLKDLIDVAVVSKPTVLMCSSVHVGNQSTSEVTADETTTVQSLNTTTETTVGPVATDAATDEPAASNNESTDEGDGGTTGGYLSSRYMEVAVGGLIAVLVVSLLGYLLYHYRVQVRFCYVTCSACVVIIRLNCVCIMYR